ncbi:acyltransferase family protein [Mycolicibacterium sp. XJ1819]
MHAVTSHPVIRAAQHRVRDDLNGLRGIAIALVVVYHLWFGKVSGGVDVFLVLSGFFFGARLLRHGADGRPGRALTSSLVRFARRLLPALVVVLAASAVLTVLIQPRTRWEAFAEQTLASLFYYQNWHLAATANDYLRAGQSVSPLQHIWSMSVQGQFLVAMLLLATLVAAVVLATGRAARRRTAMIAVIAVVTVASFVYATITHHVDQTLAYYDSFARAWELLAGVLAAVVISAVDLPRWARVAAAVVGLGAIFSCGILLDGAAQFPGPWALVPVGATVLLIFSGAGVSSTDPWPNRFMAAAPLVTLGSMAYSLYLWHWPLLIFWLVYTDRETVGFGDGLLVFAASLACAYLTLRLVEDPLRERGPSPTAEVLAPRRATAALGCFVALLAVALTAASVTWRGHVDAVRADGTELQTLAARDYPGGRALIDQLRVAQLPVRPTVLEATAEVPATTVDGCITDFAGTHVIRCVYGDPEAPRTIALAGGSHAEHWITALDLLGRSHGFQVVTYLKMGCPLTTDEEPRIAGSKKPYPECREWVRTAMDTMIADRPDYVFTTTTRPDPRAPGDMVPDGYLGIWDEFDANGLPILGVRDTPWMSRDGMMFSPVDCLANGGDAESCGVPRDEALADHNPTLAHTHRYPLLTALDLSDAVCRDDVCRAVEGNVLIYHDAHHLSATYVRTLADELGRQIAAATGWW